MALDFPNSPTVGATYSSAGVVWQWDGTKWESGNSTSGFAPINSPVFTGDPKAPTPAYGDNDQSVPNTSFVQSAVTPLTHNVGRNLLHNALYQVQQRGQGTWSSSGSVTYTADRWFAFGASGDTVTAQLSALGDADRSAIGDEAAEWCLSWTFAGTSTANAQSDIDQRVEDVRRLGGKTVTVSFWAKASSGTPKIGVSSFINYGAGGSPSAAVIAALGATPALSSTWTRYAVTGTLPSTAGKTLGTTAGTSYTQITLVGSDASNTYLTGIGVQSGTVQFWGMQLEIGGVATPLEKLDPRLDLANCQRFYIAFPSYVIVSGYNAASGTIYANIVFPVTMRAVPTVTFVSPSYNNTSGMSSNTVTTAVLVMQAAITAAGAGWALAPVTLSADL